MRMLSLAVVAMAVLSVGCSKQKAPAEAPAKAVPAAGAAAPNTPQQPAPAAAKAAPAAKAKAKASGKRYTIEVAPTNLTVGGKATVQLTVKPAKGFKFNKEFPAKFIVNATKFAKCDKPKLSKRGGDVKEVHKTGVVTIPLTGLAAGSGDLSVQASFSICNDEQCYVLRGEMLTLPVTVK